MPLISIHTCVRAHTHNENFVIFFLEKRNEKLSVRRRRKKKTKVKKKTKENLKNGRNKETILKKEKAR